MVWKRAALAAALVVVAGAGRAQAEPVNPDGPVVPSDSSGGPGLPRTALIAWNLSVDALFTATHAVELARGRRPSLVVSGLELVLTAPAVAFAAEAVTHDPHDYVMIGFTAWGAALLVRSVIMIATHSRTAPERAPRRPGLTVGPALMRSGGGLAVGGGF
jgi:hypothetical protein